MLRSVMRAALWLLVACAVLLVGCSEHIACREVRSPDGRLILRIEINESGGAAVSDVTSAFIVLSQPSTAHRQLIFEGSAMSYFDARWVNSGQVRLSFQGGYVTTCNSLAVLPPNFKVTVLGCK